MDAVEEIKRRLNASDVISSYIQTKPAGRNLRALCPFHHEKTPSFMISDEKGIWHCFGCGEGGDIFGFVMRMEGLDFKGALENLAAKANVPLEESGLSKQGRQAKQRYLRLTEAAAKYYQAQLRRNVQAQAYLKQRGISDKSINEFRLGWAPASGTSLVKFLTQKSVKPAEMEKAGLTRTYQRGAKGINYDLFKERLMIPLVDSLDKVVGFTGRVLDDGLPKYLNTPQTLLFDKSRFIFGLNLAKEAIRKNDEVVMVEGHLDVIASHQINVRQTVASGGTALTLPQLKQLARFTKNVKLAFDQDEAGVVATERAIPIAQAAGVSLYIVDTGSAKDPDELIRQEGGLMAWQKAINKAVYVMDWLLETLPAQYDLKSALDKKRLTDRVMSTLGNLQDAVEQDHYVQALSKLVGTSPEIIRQKLLTTNPAQAKVSRQAVYQAPIQHDEHRAVEEELLGITAAYPDTRTGLKDLSTEHFSEDKRRILFKYLRGHTDKSVAGKLPADLRPIANYIKILLLKGEEGYNNWASLDRRIEAFSLSARLHRLYIKNLRIKLNQEIQTAEAEGNDKKRLELLKQFRDLSQKSGS